jgi:hypothetical protein
VQHRILPFGKTHGGKLGATHFRGSKPIDGVWDSKGITISNVRAMPVGFGIGDHRMIVVDFTTESMVGINPQAVVRPGAR